MDELSAPPTNSAARAIVILEFLASSPEQTFTFSEIARFCGLRKSTAYTILGILQRAGWLTRSPADLKYGLGPTFIAIAHAVEETRPELNLARPIMNSLAIEFQRECVLSTAIGDEIVTLESVGGAVRGVPSGHRTPWLPPYGAVFVAWRDPSVRKEWISSSADLSPEQMDVLEGILDATATRGYVVTLRSDVQAKIFQIMHTVAAERTIHDVRRALREQLAHLPPLSHLLDDRAVRGKIPVATIQAPVFDADGIANYALTVGSIDQELDGHAIARYGLRIRKAADDISLAIASHARGGAATEARR